MIHEQHQHVVVEHYEPRLLPCAISAHQHIFDLGQVCVSACDVSVFRGPVCFSSPSLRNRGREEAGTGVAPVQLQPPSARSIAREDRAPSGPLPSLPEPRASVETADRRPKSTTGGEEKEEPRENPPSAACFPCFPASSSTHFHFHTYICSPFSLCV